MLCVSWRRALKNVWKLPMTTHSNIIYGLSGKHPIEVEFMFRCLKFNFQCMNSENHVVRNVARHSVFVSGCFSLFGRNFLHCCQFFKLLVATPDYNFNLQYETVLRSLHSKNFTAQVSNLNVIFELIMLRDNVYSLPHNHLDKSDIQLLLNHLCSD